MPLGGAGVFQSHHFSVSGQVKVALGRVATLGNHLTVSDNHRPDKGFAFLFEASSKAIRINFSCVDNIAVISSTDDGDIF